jgi:hypothetical protein
MKESSDFNNGSYGAPPLFREVQYFRNVPFVALAILGLAAVEAFLSYQFYMFSQKGAPLYPLIFPIGVSSLLIILLLTAKLEVEVYTGMFRYRFFPLLPFWRQMERSSVETAEAVAYKPMREFGGWGIRYGRNMWAYTVSGSKGVIIKIRGGRTFMLGSKMAEELQRSIVAAL